MDEQLRYKITADDSQAGKVLDNFAKKLEQTQPQAGGNIFRSIGDKAQEFGRNIPVDGVERLGAAFSATGPLAAGVLVFAALSAAAKQTIGIIDNLDEAAQGVGTTAVALSELRIGASEAGVDADQLTRALAALNIKAAEAASGNVEAAAAFKRFGVDVKDSAGNLKTTEALLGDLADATRKFGNDAQRTQALADVFGQKLGPRLAAYLAQGSEALRVNSGLTQDMVDAAVRAQREIDKTAASWERLKLAIGGAAATAINAFNDAVAGVRVYTADNQLKVVQARIASLKKEASQRQNPETLIAINEQLTEAVKLAGQLEGKQIDRFMSGVNAASKIDLAQSIGGKERPSYTPAK